MNEASNNDKHLLELVSYIKPPKTIQKKISKNAGQKWNYEPTVQK